MVDLERRKFLKMITLLASSLPIIYVLKDKLNVVQYYNTYKEYENIFYRRIRELKEKYNIDLSNLYLGIYPVFYNLYTRGVIASYSFEFESGNDKVRYGFEKGNSVVNGEEIISRKEYKIRLFSTISNILSKWPKKYYSKIVVGIDNSSNEFKYKLEEIFKNDIGIERIDFYNSNQEQYKTTSDSGLFIDGKKIIDGSGEYTPDIKIVIEDKNLENDNDKIKSLISDILDVIGIPLCYEENCVRNYSKFKHLHNDQNIFVGKRCKSFIEAIQLSEVISSISYYNYNDGKSYDLLYFIFSSDTLSTYVKSSLEHNLKFILSILPEIGKENFNYYYDIDKYKNSSYIVVFGGHATIFKVYISENVNNIKFESLL